MESKSNYKWFVRIGLLLIALAAPIFGWPSIAGIEFHFKPPLNLNIKNYSLCLK
jgi:hypothetical protein